MMLAEQDKCDRFMTTVSIADPKSAATFTGQFNPRPLGPYHIEEPMLMIPQKSLAKVFTTTEEDESEFRIEFKVSEKRTIEDDEDDDDEDAENYEDSEDDDDDPKVF